ncbi:hypothetical protein AB0K14_37445 [Actinosynnema sp. NPDC050801]|uniref:DUF7683 domain-containing protein n=1 Tax=unclassified Actinosynnema TaxID=2637065 RepID=UPI0033FCE0A8
MSWVLLAFEKEGDAFVAEISLPESIDHAAVKSLVGDYPNLRGDSFPVTGASLDRLADVLKGEVRPGDYDYFIEFRE